MRWNILGNGDNSSLYKRGTEGSLLICNMPPFEIPRKEVYATCMVDYKMMMALARGEVKLDMYDWILGNRPRHWMEMNPTFYMKYSQNVKGFHLHVPEYAKLTGQTRSQAATNYSCGHMALDYACRVKNATEIHVYGFDSMFDTNIRSFTDLLLESDRSAQNTHRIANNWRPVWQGFFKEFSNVKFYLHHVHDKLKFPVGSNVEVVVEEKKK